MKKLGWLCLFAVGCGAPESDIAGKPDLGAEWEDGQDVGTAQQAFGEPGCSYSWIDVVLATDGSAVSPNGNYGSFDCPHAYVAATVVVASPRFAYAEHAGPEPGYLFGGAGCQSMTAQVSVWKQVPIPPPSGSGGVAQGPIFTKVGDSPVTHGVMDWLGNCYPQRASVALPGPGTYRILGQAATLTYEKVKVGTSTW